MADSMYTADTLDAPLSPRDIFDQTRDLFLSCMNNVSILSSKRDSIAFLRNCILVDSPKEILRIHRNLAYDSRVDTTESIVVADLSLIDLRFRLKDLISSCSDHNSSAEMCKKCKILSDQVENFNSEIHEAILLSYAASDEAENRTSREPAVEKMTSEEILLEVFSSC